MNNIQLRTLLNDYPVTVCAANQIRKRTGRFVISNTDTSKGLGKHWVTFYFPTDGPDEFFDSLGHTPEHYHVGFEQLLQNPYWMICDPIQDTNSDVCGLYCIYYVMNRYLKKTMKDIVAPFNVHNRAWNDKFVVEYVNKNKP